MVSEVTQIHKPVMLQECVELVCDAAMDSARRDGRDQAVIVDCTLGLAGHTTAFLSALPQARVIGIDRDAQALELATKRVSDAGFGQRFTPVHAAFDQLDSVLNAAGIKHVDAVFMDLGLSSLQIDETSRGFSYSQDSPLDMRMDKRQALTAHMVLATYEVDELITIFRTFGEERFSAPIAREIVRRRDMGEVLETSRQLTDLVDRVVPKAKRPAGNPAKRVFQALRIEVNGELDKLESTLPQALEHMSVGARLVVESYHSLEDKAVKKFMSRGLHADVPVGIPVIPEEAQPYFADITRGALKASKEEIEYNPRSASVRLRAVEVTRTVPDRAFESKSDKRSKCSRHSGFSKKRERS